MGDDHFLCLPMIGMIGLTVRGIERRRIGGCRRRICPCATMAVAAVLAGGGGSMPQMLRQLRNAVGLHGEGETRRVVGL